MARAPRSLSVHRIALLLWLAVALAALFVYRDAIPALGLRDTDDNLRLVQVRDLIAGQDWFDVTQYRINPEGGGGLMHWSRFIDMQIAALIALFGIVLPAEAAERWAVALYPLLLILPLFLLFARILVRLGDRRQAIAGLLIAATGVTFLHYFAPLRIDHHNWQLLLSVTMLWLALGEPRVLRGLAAALVIAAHVEISLEGLPYLAVFGALFALDWLRDPGTAPRLTGFAAGLLVFPALWLLVFRGTAPFTAAYCDGFSLPYAAAVAAAAAVLLAGALRFDASWRLRLAVLALAGAAGIGTFLIFGRPCLDGPFGALEPLVRTHWYEMVKEGRPLWEQDADAAAIFLAPLLVGLGAALWAWRRARGSAWGDNWTRLLFVLLGGSLLSLTVFRTGAVTHAWLVPAFGAMALGLWDWSRARRTAIGRVGAAMLLLAAIPAVDAWLAGRAVQAMLPSTPKRSSGQEACPTAAMLAPLAREPAALLFAPIDTGPTLLVHTPHSVVATGHHRNHAAMNRVIAALIADPDAAVAIVRASGARFVVLCADTAESGNPVRAHPHGLAARLSRGEPVAGLSHDAMLSQRNFRVYRVVR
ncbi:MAG TPA: hypothetical protein PKD99_05365 [Sphingopyxis sp.]|nr:hypothetical protein [Sphingopyxis sp.]